MDPETRKREKKKRRKARKAAQAAQAEAAPSAVTAPEEIDQVTFMGETWKLRPPRDFALANDIVTLGAYNATRAFAAALVVCWGGKRTPKIRYRECGHNPGDFGGKAVNLLVARGAKIDEIIEAGGLAYASLMRSYLSQAEVDDAADFSEPGGAGVSSG